MSILNYLQSLLPNNETSTILRSTKNIKNVISKHTLPAAEQLVSVLDHNWDFKNKDMAELNKYLSVEMPKRMEFKYRSPNMLICAVYGLQCALKNLDVVEGVVPKLFKADAFSTSGITYSKAAVLQYIEACDFFVKYARCLFNYASSAELNEVQGVKDTKAAGPNDLDYLKSRRLDFLRIATAVSLNTVKTKWLLQKASDMLVTTNDDSAVKAIAGTEGTDPFGFSSLPFPISFIFRIRMNSMSSEVDNYEASKAEALAVEYRILLLKEHIENGYGDALVEKSLEVQEDRLLKLKRSIEKAEEDYELN